MYLLIVKADHKTHTSLGAFLTFDECFVKAVERGLSCFEIWCPAMGLRRNMTLTFHEPYPNVEGV